MTEDCPGYDRDRRVCLIRPDDCEFAAAVGDASLVLEAPDELTPEAPGEAALRSR